MKINEIKEIIKNFNKEEYTLRKKPENEYVFPEDKPQEMIEFFDRKDDFINAVIKEYNAGGELRAEFETSGVKVEYYDNDMVNPAYDKVTIILGESKLSFMPTVVDGAALKVFLERACNFYSRIDNEYPPVDEEDDYEYDVTELDHFPTEGEMKEVEELRQRKFNCLFLNQ